MSLGLSAVIWGIITLSLLVLVHEGGHFFAARALGLRVREFMIGLPGPKLSFKYKNTVYGITAIPLGGYVKIVGMEGDGHSPLLEPVLTYITTKQTVTLDELAQHFDCTETKMYTVMTALKDLQAVTEDKTGAFHAEYVLNHEDDSSQLFAKVRANTYLTAPMWKRVTALLAGVFCNVAVAILVFTVVLAGWGTYQDVGKIDTVAKSPAALAGLTDGTRIISLDGIDVATFEELSAQIQKHHIGEEVTLSYTTDEDSSSVPKDLKVTLAKNPQSDTPFLGVSPHYVQVPLPVGEAFGTSFSYLWLTVKGIAGFFNPAKFVSSVNNSASVIGIAVVAAEAVRAGPIDYAWLVAAISLSLGLMNLLPIPPLDGGKIVLEIIEKIRRKPLSLNVSLAISMVGFSLLFMLMAYLMYNDIGRLIAR